MGGPAWEWDAATGQYYYHAFLKEQADLNWRNPEVQAAMLEAMRFWFDKGVDGFRIDVLWHMVKHADFPDNPANEAYTPAMGEMHRVLQLHSTDQPEVHAIAAEMRTLADSYPVPRVLIGEIYLPVPKLMDYYGRERPGVHLPFNFQLVDAPWDAGVLATLIAEYEAALPAGGWPNWVLGNHDRPRSATKRGQAQARVAAMLLLTLRGTPTLYYGDEIGMVDGVIPAELVQDPLELREPGIGRGRDPVRTPMAWDGGPGAGFTTGVPWLPIHDDFATRNVEAQAADPASMLSLTRELLALRKAHPVLSLGAMGMVRAEGDVLLYERSHAGERLVVALNLSALAQAIDLPAGERLISTVAGVGGGLRPNEGVVIRT